MILLRCISVRVCPGCHRRVVSVAVSEIADHRYRIALWQEA